jgi:hypothetical protein
MSIVKRTLEIAEHAYNGGKQFSLIVTTRAGAFEGNAVDFEDGVLRLEVCGTSGPTGNDLFIAESAIEMIEIDWADTYGLCNGEEEAVAAHAYRQAVTGKRDATDEPFGADRLKTYHENVGRILNGQKPIRR